MKKLFLISLFTLLLTSCFNHDEQKTSNSIEVSFSSEVIESTNISNSNDDINSSENELSNDITTSEDEKKSSPLINNNGDDNDPTSWGEINWM